MNLRQFHLEVFVLVMAVLDVDADVLALLPSVFGSPSYCCSVVGSVVVCVDAAADSFGVLCGGLYVAGNGTAVRAVVNLFNPLLLMMSINCLLYFSGIGRLLVVLERKTFFAIPRSVSPDAVSLPSQIAGRNLFSSFGRSFTSGRGLFLHIHIVVFDVLCSIFCRSRCCRLHVLHIY